MFTAMKFRQLTTVVATTALLLFSTAQAQVVTPATLTVDDNKIQAKLTLSSLIEVDLTVEFENSIGLNANNIDITAELLDPHRFDHYRPPALSTNKRCFGFSGSCINLSES